MMSNYVPELDQTRRALYMYILVLQKTEHGFYYDPYCMILVLFLMYSTCILFRCIYSTYMYCVCICSSYKYMNIGEIGMCTFVLAHVHVLYTVYAPLPILVQCQWCRTATNILIHSELEQLVIFRDLF